MEYLQHPLIRGAVAGLGAAVLIDVLTFMKWKSWDDAKAFDVRVAALRWMQGFVGGFLTTAGVNVAL